MACESYANQKMIASQIQER